MGQRRRVPAKTRTLTRRREKQHTSESKKDSFQEMARGMELVEGWKMDAQAHTKDQGVGTPRPRLDGIPPHAGTQRPRVLWSVSSKRGHRPNSNCRLCGEEEDDRRELAAQVGSLLSKENIIATMLKSPDSWDKIASFIRKVIKIKEEKERNKKKRLIGEEIQLPKRGPQGPEQAPPK